MQAVSAPASRSFLPQKTFYIEVLYLTRQCKLATYQIGHSGCISLCRHFRFILVMVYGSIYVPFKFCVDTCSQIKMANAPFQNFSVKSRFSEYLFIQNATASSVLNLTSQNWVGLCLRHVSIRKKWLHLFVVRFLESRVVKLREIRNSLRNYTQFLVCLSSVFSITVSSRTLKLLC